MIKKLLLLILIAIVLGSNSGLIYAQMNAKQDSLEDFHTENGYQSVTEAVKEFEQHYLDCLNLPLRIPPINFTHSFGRFNDLEGDINDSLEIIFIHEKLSKHHFKIDVRPINRKIPVKDQHVTNVYKLKDGNDAKLMKVSGFHVLVFEKGNWQYMLNIAEEATDVVTPEELVAIANSIAD